jgi:threonine dehydratase
VTVDEEEIANAILLLLEREKTVAEGAGAAPVAALVQRKLAISDQRVTVLVAGGNIDPMFLSRIIERGLVKDGRLVRFRLRVPDHAGALARLTAVVAGQLANILEIGHDRAYYGVNLGDSVVEMTLETRGAEHIQELVKALEAAGYRPERVT